MTSNGQGKKTELTVKEIQMAKVICDSKQYCTYEKCYAFTKHEVGDGCNLKERFCGIVNNNVKCVEIEDKEVHLSNVIGSAFDEEIEKVRSSVENRWNSEEIINILTRLKQSVISHQ